MKIENIRDGLIEPGKKLFKAPWQPYPHAKHPEADALLNDLENFQYAFVLAYVMDRQIKAEKARLIPYPIKQKIEDFSIETLRSLSWDDINRLMTEPEPLHQFPTIMYAYFFYAL